jgi:hypothetical protein
MIQVQYQLTLDDYREANEAFNRSWPAQLLVNWFLGIVLVLMGTFIVGVSLLFPRDVIDNRFYGAFALLYGLFLIGSVTVWQRMRVAKSWQEHPYMA